MKTSIFENGGVGEKFLKKILKFWPIFLRSIFQRSTHISKSFSPTTPLSTHQSIDLGELYNFVVGVEVWGWSFVYTLGQFLDLGHLAIWKIWDLKTRKCSNFVNKQFQRSGGPKTAKNGAQKQENRSTALCEALYDSGIGWLKRGDFSTSRPILLIFQKWILFSGGPKNCQK